MSPSTVLAGGRGVDVLAVSRRDDLTPIQTTYVLAALAHRGSRDAVARLIEMGQAFLNEMPDPESVLGRHIQGFAGGLLLRPDIKVLKRLNCLRWESWVLAYSISIAARGSKPPGQRR